MSATSTPRHDGQSDLQLAVTSTGVRFGLWGHGGESPAPVLIVLSGSIEESLGDPYYRQCGTLLGSQAGFLCVSIDLPAHGAQQRDGERFGLDGWRDRIGCGENFVADNNQRLRDVLDHLMANDLADPARLAVCGTSRGGFLAMHFAAVDPRVKCAAAFAPVTELAVLREFKDAEDNALVQSLALGRLAKSLAIRPVWVVIGDRDTRVGTDAAVGFVREVTAAALATGGDPRAEIHVLPEPRGHTTPPGAPADAARWIRSQLLS